MDGLKETAHHVNRVSIGLVINPNNPYKTYSQTEQSNKGTDVRSLIDAVGNAGVDIEVSGLVKFKCLD